MALLVQFLLLAILGTCICEQMPEMEMETWPERVNLETHGMAHAQGPTAGTIAPYSIVLTGHAYDIDGVYVATDQRFNGYPVYEKPGSSYYKVYYRIPEYKQWVADRDEVGAEWSGITAYWPGGLFNSDAI